MNEKIKFIFWGTPIVASKTLQILIDAGLIPEVVITNPDRPSGRGLTFSPSPVKILAQKYNIPVLTPEKLDEKFLDKLSTCLPAGRLLNFELNIVVAYGKILPENIINMPKYGTINIHYSLLPKYRGASPLESALLNGDTETGISIQKMVKKMDAGPILSEKKIEINNTISKDELREILINEGVNLLVKILPDYIDGKIELQDQDETQASHCKKIQKQDGEINPDGDPILNYNKYRAYSGWPGVFFFKDGMRIKITRARLEDGKFIIEKIIPEGKKEQDYLL